VAVVGAQPCTALAASDLTEEQLVLKLTLGKRPFRVAVAKVEVPGIRELVGVRPQTTDEPTFAHVFLNREYDIELPLEPRLIIDAGANVGYASVRFANRYPHAQIIAIEPSPANFPLLRENTASYANVSLLQAGVWPRACHLKIVTHDSNGKFLGEWGFQVEETDQPAADTLLAVTLGEVLRESGQTAIDLLKLDVEGAEKDIFSTSCDDWLPRTNVILIELHDRFRPGCSDAFFSAVSTRHFYQAQRGQTLIFIRKKLVS
jgi:FkbM family methyltransferase